MKKLIALLLALVLALSFAACGGTTTTTPPDVLVDTPVEEPETLEQPGTSEEEPTEWDGDYETATFDDIRKYGYGSTQWDGSLPLTTTGEQLEIGLRTDSSVTNYEKNPQTQYFQEVTGIDLVIREFAGSTSDVSTQISLMFTGGEDMPDILQVTSEGNARRSEYIEAGYFVNLAGYYMTDAYYFTEAFELACGSDPIKYATQMNLFYNYTANQQTGQVYGMPNVYDNPTDLVYVEACINTEWLQKLNLSMPTTIDELYDVLVAFRDQDPNGNGKKDEIPMMGLNHKLGEGVDHYIVNAFIQFAGARKAMIEDGKAFSSQNQDEYREALKFMNKLVKEGLLSELAFTGTQADLRNMLNFKGGPWPAKVGICCAYITGDYDEYSDAWKIYEPLPALKDAGYGRGGYSLFDAPTTQSTYAITSSCENVRLAFRLLDVMFTKESYLVQRWGQEGVDWDWIENTEYKDMAEGNGVYGGTARYVIYNKGFREQSRWHVICGYADEMNFQVFVHPEKNDFVNTYYKKSAENVLMQQSIGQPEEQLLVFLRTPEEDELFHEYNTELTSLITTALCEFSLGIRDPYSDKDWQTYLDALDKLHFERWAEFGQASYDRQKAELDAIREKMANNG